ncbi:hypothetical protein ACJJTC_010639 [Scirpophaga incertulas]
MQWVAAGRAAQLLVSNICPNIGGDAGNGKVFVREALTPRTKYLLAKAKSELKDKYKSTESGLSEADTNGHSNGSPEDATERERALREKARVSRVFDSFKARALMKAQASASSHIAKARAQPRAILQRLEPSLEP